MNKDLPGIKYTKGITNPTIDSSNAGYALEFEKDKDYFVILENFVNFVKNVEKEFRGSIQYKKYVAYIKGTVGLKRCQIHANMEEKEDGTNKLALEMHHGPIFTLFDIVSIIVDDQLKRGNRITTFSIANLVAEEHFNNNVQVVMVCKTCHELVHAGEVTLHYNQAWGDLSKFLKKYKAGLTPELFAKLKRYIEMCKENDVFTNDILRLDKTISRWNDRFDEIYY